MRIALRIIDAGMYFAMALIFAINSIEVQQWYYTILLAVVSLLLALMGIQKIIGTTHKEGGE